MITNKIRSDFEKIHFRLKQLEKIYNPQNENLHFTALERADTKLYSELLALAQEGLRTVRQHRKYFSKHPLYDDGMFWYCLFLITSSAAARVSTDKIQGDIPSDIVKKLTELLVEISEFSTVHHGDIVKRNYEALANTLCAFYTKDLIDLVREKSSAMDSKAVTDFVNWTIRRVEEIVKDR